ncbi:MAG: L-histidine N(alpha)-methyltransferase, partial [Planctomycetota bacterium]
LIEFGSGNSEKSRVLLDACRQHVGGLSAYVPLDISGPFLETVAQTLRQEYPGLTVLPVAGDFTQPVELPALPPHRRRVGFFPGSTIGNFGPGAAAAVLRTFHDAIGVGGGLILGADLIKEAAVLEAAYDDAAGVTAAFNRNLLTRINRELDADFPVDSFQHESRWNARKSRIEMHLVSDAARSVTVAERRFDFAKEESIHTENSYKFSREMLSGLAAEAGFRIDAVWTDPDERFAVAAMTAEPTA